MDIIIKPVWSGVDYAKMTLHQLEQEYVGMVAYDAMLGREYHVMPEDEQS